MTALDCTLLSDGSSDAVLLPVLEWILRQHVSDVAVHCTWADLRRLPSPPRSLAERISKAVELYPCQVLFVHRDAENQAPELRYTEIREAVKSAFHQGPVVPHICVVPVRMQEVWLLLDVAAIRRAAGNPNGTHPLQLPRATSLETLPDPKEVLHGLLADASGLSGRRLKRFRAEKCTHLVPQYMGCLSDLRRLPAFQRLEQDVHNTVSMLLASRVGCCRFG